MQSKTLSNQFIFNEKIDPEALFSLYTDDFSYIEEIFATTLQHFDADFSMLQLAFENNSTEDLKKAIHKIKPTFGYTGLLDIQQSCKQFEEQCAAAHDISEVADNYTSIKNLLLEGRDIIEKDYSRLKVFNANPI